MILEDGSFDMAVTWYYISFILIVNWILLQARLLPNPAGQLFILSTGYSLNSLNRARYGSSNACWLSIVLASAFQVTVAVLVDCFVDASNAADKSESDAQLAEFREARQVPLPLASVAVLLGLLNTLDYPYSSLVFSIFCNVLRDLAMADKK